MQKAARRRPCNSAVMIDHTALSGVTTALDALAVETATVGAWISAGACSGAGSSGRYAAFAHAHSSMRGTQSRVG
jgi:hypothetical protein